jgi:hypothetical protein
MSHPLAAAFPGAPGAPRRPHPPPTPGKPSNAAHRAAVPAAVRASPHKSKVLCHCRKGVAGARPWRGAAGRARERRPAPGGGVEQPRVVENGAPAGLG